MNNLLAVLNSDKKIFEEALPSFIGSEYDELAPIFDAMNYSLGSGGKRIRPVLTMEFCRFFGGDVNDSLSLAAALEMVHTYSLIHDDLPCMDNSDFRRGRQTNHRIYGEANALLAGDGLLTHAFGTVASSEWLAEAVVIEAVALLSKMAGPNGMVGGQFLDLLGEETPLTEGQHLLMNSLKTGCLIRTACLFGVLAAGYDSSSEEYEAADRYGSAVGLAYQIRDDILDSKEGEDEGKITFLSFMTEEEANEKILSLTSEAKEALSAFSDADPSFLDGLADYLAGRNT